jgi:N-formylglutamate amidohydrolase
VERSLALYDDFYAMLAETIEARLASFDHVVLFDLHAYNHRRNGPDAEPEDPVLNPEVNVGTGTMDRELWAPIVDRLIAAMRAPVEGTTLDVRENVKFRGGNMVRWLHETYPRRVCAIAIEIKKTYMDEWSGAVDRAVSRRLHASLQAAADQMRDSLAEPCSEPQPTPSPTT